jgi:membrane protease subunit HflK
MNDHDQVQHVNRLAGAMGPPPPVPMPPEEPVDAGSQALSEALRSSFAIVKVVMIVLVLVFFASGFFIVGPQERGMVLRLGKPLGEGEKALLGPGLHYSLPYPIDDHIIVSISGLQQLRSTPGWYATTPAAEAAGTEIAPSPGTPINPAVDGYVLTADANIIHSRATLTYRISDPVRYVFSFVNASNAVMDTLSSAVLYSASRFTVDQILIRDVAGFNDAVRRRMNELLKERNLGIEVEQCFVQSIWPRQIRDAYNDVLKAEVARNKAMDDASKYRDQVLTKASADAGSRINAAQSDRVRLVNELSSRADQFLELLPKYEQNPNLFVQERLLETLGRVLTNVEDKIYVPEAADGNQKELRLLLNRELKLKTGEPGS